MLTRVQTFPSLFSRFLLLWSHKTQCKQDQGVTILATESGNKKLAVKQLLLCSHKTHSKQDQSVKNLAKVSPWIQYTLDRVR